MYTWIEAFPFDDDQSMSNSVERSTSGVGWNHAGGPTNNKNGIIRKRKKREELKKLMYILMNHGRVDGIDEIGVELLTPLLIELILWRKIDGLC